MTPHRALEWLLPGDARPDPSEAAREAAQQYASRWLVEAFHRCLETGSGAEALQRQTVSCSPCSGARP